MQYVIVVTCHSLGFQVHLRSVNFDLRTLGWGYAAMPDL